MGPRRHFDRLLKRQIKRHFTLRRWIHPNASDIGNGNHLFSFPFRFQTHFIYSTIYIFFFFSFSSRVFVLGWRHAETLFYFSGGLKNKKNFFLFCFLDYHFPFSKRELLLYFYFISFHFISLVFIYHFFFDRTADAEK